ncbi:MAG: hypothetical protein A2391_00105 [Candidatus Brennerbacteria bacterium RIFOXYB1_FULL_41_13]|nr:MAG: hypothetical protein A2391_00105 [Candidatus Brennerbacteria bacterium RIFOXYB1_FULL_41_13]
MKKSFIPYISLSLSMIIVGSTVVVGRVLANQFPVFLASGLSLLLASVIFGMLAFKSKGIWSGLTRSDFFIIFLQALFGTFVYRIFFLYGLKFSSAFDAGIILSTTPAVTGLLSLMFLKEKLDSNKILGILFSVVGVLLINLVYDNATNGSRSNILIGSLLIFGCVIGQALFSVLPKALSQSVTPMAIASLTTVISFLLFLPMSIYEALNFDFTTVGLGGWASIIYYGLFATVVAFLLWFKGLSSIEASASGVFTALVPISAMIFSYLILRERIYTIHIIGAACVILGIVFIHHRGSLTRKVD